MDDEGKAACVGPKKNKFTTDITFMKRLERFSKKRKRDMDEVCVKE